jgi:hypothetical protein
MVSLRKKKEMAEPEIDNVMKEMEEKGFSIDDIKEAGQFVDEYDKLAQSSEVTTPDEAIAKISMILADSKEVDILSDLTSDEVALLSSLKTVAVHTENTLLSSFVNNFLRFRISRNRKGREEIIQVARARGGEEEKMRKGFRSMVLGMK